MLAFIGTTPSSCDCLKRVEILWRVHRLLLWFKMQLLQLSLISPHVVEHLVICTLHGVKFSNDRSNLRSFVFFHRFFNALKLVDKLIELLGDLSYLGRVIHVIERVWDCLWITLLWSIWGAWDLNRTLSCKVLRHWLVLESFEVVSYTKFSVGRDHGWHWGQIFYQRFLKLFFLLLVVQVYHGVGSRLSWVS